MWRGVFGKVGPVFNTVMSEAVDTPLGLGRTRGAVGVAYWVAWSWVMGG